MQSKLKEEYFVIKESIKRQHSFLLKMEQLKRQWRCTQLLICSKMLKNLQSKFKRKEEKQWLLKI